MRKHRAEPRPDSMIRERDRAKADGDRPADDYPLLARCESCRREIRIEAGSGWKHTAAPRPPRVTADLRPVGETAS